MARTNVSISELEGVLKRAGIPKPSFDPRDVADVNAEQGIAGQVRSEGNPIIDEAKKNYLAQINRIAEMDQKLSGVYSDPNSKLYIEHAGQRQNALTGAQNVGYQAAQGFANTIDTAQKAVETKVNDLTSLYSKLLERRKGQEGTAQEIAALKSIFPGVDLTGSLEGVLNPGVDASGNQRPSLDKFDQPERPPLESFHKIPGVDIYSQPLG